MRQDKASILIRALWDANRMSDRGWHIVWHERNFGYNRRARTVTFSIADLNELKPSEVRLRAHQLIGYALNPPKPGERHKWLLPKKPFNRAKDPAARIRRVKELLAEWQRKEHPAKNIVRKYQRELDSHRRRLRADARRLIEAFDARHRSDPDMKDQFNDEQTLRNPIFRECKTEVAELSELRVPSASI